MLTADSRLHRKQEQHLAEQLIFSDQACSLLPVQKSGVQSYLLFRPDPKAMPAGFFKPGSSHVSYTGTKSMHSAAPHLCSLKSYANSHGNVMGTYTHITLQSIRSTYLWLCSYTVMEASGARRVQKGLR